MALNLITIKNILNLTANNLNDVTCAATAYPANDHPNVQTAADLLIYIDFSWQFNEIQPIVA